MKYYGKSEQVLNQILKAFETGQIPKAIAQVFIKRNDESPCRQWSLLNQMIVAMHGHSEARGFRQWQEVERYVKKGQKAFQILGPVYIKVNKEKEAVKPEKAEEAIEDDTKLIGFRTINVFGLEQTYGKPIEVDQEAENWLNNLPLIEVARSWGLSVQSYNGQGAKELGRYTRNLLTGQGISITIGTNNLSTWAHELVHAADHKLGNLRTHGKKLNEIVAELGGAVLLECIGLTQEADRGGAFQYINHWAPENPIQDCRKVIARTCKAVDLIIKTAQQLTTEAAA